MRVTEDQNKVIVELYRRLTLNEVDSIDDIPVESLRVFLLMDYRDIVSPLVREMLCAGKTLSQISNKYKLTRKEVRKIGYYMGLTSK